MAFVGEFFGRLCDYNDDVCLVVRKAVRASAGLRDATISQTTTTDVVATVVAAE